MDNNDNSSKAIRNGINKASNSDSVNETIKLGTKAANSNSNSNSVNNSNTRGGNNTNGSQLDNDKKNALKVIAVSVGIILALIGLVVIVQKDTGNNSNGNSSVENEKIRSGDTALAGSFITKTNGNIELIKVSYRQDIAISDNNSNNDNENSQNIFDLVAEQSSAVKGSQRFTEIQNKLGFIHLTDSKNPLLDKSVSNLTMDEYESTIESIVKANVESELAIDNNLSTELSRELIAIQADKYLSVNDIFMVRSKVMTLMNAGKAHLAIKLLNSLETNIDGKDLPFLQVDIDIKLARCYLLLNNPQKAIIFLNKAQDIELRVNSIMQELSIAILQAQIQATNGDYYKAIDSLERLLLRYNGSLIDNRLIGYIDYCTSQIATYRLFLGDYKRACTLSWELIGRQINQDRAISIQGLEVLAVGLLQLSRYQGGQLENGYSETGKEYLKLARIITSNTGNGAQLETIGLISRYYRIE